jgi:ferredoxin
LTSNNTGRQGSVPEHSSLPHENPTYNNSGLAGGRLFFGFTNRATYFKVLKSNDKGMIMIFYFTGTGNSRYAAQIIQSITGDTVVSINTLIKKGPSEPFTSEKPFVFVCPIYAWRIPRVVEKFISKNEFKGNRIAYFILTCGKESGDAAKYVRKLCTQKGFELLGVSTVVMPENYVAMYEVPDKETAEKKIQKATPEIHALALEINGRRILKEEKSGLVGKIQSTIINPLLYLLFVNAKGFHSTEACTHCGHCVRVCPLNNITLTDKGNPTWGRDCTHCMACICGCPSTAIEYKRNTQGKPRYYNTGFKK